MSKTNTAPVPRLWVGTWAKYNEGNLHGKWFDLEDYSDADEFYEAAKEFHKDERDPEFLFNDFEGFPESFYEESSIHDKLFDFVHLDEDDREVVTAYAGATGYDDFDFDDATDRLSRVYDGYTTGGEFARDFVDDTGGEKVTPEWLVIDWEATWNANLRHDFIRHYDDEKTYFFLNH